MCQILNQILHEEECNSLGFDLCEDDLSVEELLDSYSYLDHSEYCLSYLFTYRTFEKGNLGLAWTATPEVVRFNSPKTRPKSDPMHRVKSFAKILQRV